MKSGANKSTNLPLGVYVRFSNLKQPDHSALNKHATKYKDYNVFDPSNVTRPWLFTEALAAEMPVGMWDSFILVYTKLHGHDK